MNQPIENQPATAVEAPSLTVGSVLSRTFHTFGREFKVFFILGLAAMTPSLVIEVLWPNGSFLGSLVDSLFTVFIQGAMAYNVYMVLTEGKASVGGALAHSLNRFGALVLVTFLLSLLLFVGFLLLIVPGLVIMCIYSLTIPVCVIEGLGARESLGRSAELTEGHRWTIFFLTIIVLAALFFIVVVASIVAMILSDNEIFSLAVATLAGALPLAFLAMMYSIIYYDLRVMKEGLSLDSLARVFD